MMRPREIAGRPWLLWWRLPTACGMAVIGVALPNQPSAFHTPAIDHGVFLLAALLLGVAGFFPTRDLGVRVAAMAAGVLACGGRAGVVVLTASSLTTGQIVTGVTVWLLVAGGIVFATVATDRLRIFGG